MAYATRLALAQLRHRPVRHVLLAVAVAIGVLVLAAAAAVATQVATRVVETTVAALPPDQRAVAVSYGGTQDPAEQAQDDRTARAALARLTPGPARAQVLFSAIADGHGTTYRLAGADDLASAVRVTAGRLPATCTPTRCEVLRVEGGPDPVLDAGLGLVVVGRGRITDPLLLGSTFSGVTPPVLLAEGAAATERLAGLERFPRGVGWVAALDPAAVADPGVEAYSTQVADTADSLVAQGRSFVLTSPTTALVHADDRARASAARATVLTATVGVLLLGIVLVAATGLRREHRALLGVLDQRGAGVRTSRWVSLVVAAVSVLAGALLGGVGVAVAHAWSALPMLAALVTAAVALAYATLRWPEHGGRAARRTAVATAVAALVVVVVAAARGVAAADDPLLAALPALTFVAGGLLAAAVWPALAGTVVRRLPARAGASRLALAAAVRRPLATTATVGFVTAAVAAVVFAGAYRATLEAGNADQAAYVVPTAVRVLPGPAGRAPRDVLGAAVPGSDVVRTTTSVRATPASVDARAATLLGVDPAELAAVDRWARTTGSPDPADTARAITTAVRTQDVSVPDGATSVSVPVLAAAGAARDAQVRLWWRDSAGQPAATLVPLSGAPVPLPPGTARRLVAVTVSESPEHAASREHRTGEGGAGAAEDAASLRLGPSSVTGWEGWTVTAGGAVGSATASADGLRIDFRLAGQTLVIRPPGSGAALPVVVDPVTAATGDQLVLAVSGQVLQVRVTGTLARFPTAGERFVLADDAALVDAVDDLAPGSLSARELWLTTDLADDHGLVVQRQAEVAGRLAADPVGQGASTLLLVGAGAALTLAVLALVLLVLGARRDEDGDLVVLEADGVGPSVQRRIVWLRGVYAAVPAALAGAVVGTVLAAATVALVVVSATGTTPVPPLATALGLPAVAVVVLAALGVGLLGAGFVAAGTARGSWPAGMQEELT